MENSQNPIAYVFKYIIETNFELTVEYADELKTATQNQITWRNVLKSIFNAYKNNVKPMGVIKYCNEYFVSKNAIINEILDINTINSENTFKFKLQLAVFNAKEEKLDKTFEKFKEELLLGNNEKAEVLIEDLLLLTKNEKIEEVSPDDYWNEVAVESSNSINDGVGTGFIGLDQISDGGYRRGHLWGVAAKTGGGKSYFMCQMYLWWQKSKPKASKQKFIMLSNEMKRHELLIRLLSMALNKPLSIIENDFLQDTDEIRKQKLEIDNSLIIYENCFSMSLVENIIRKESNKGNWIIVLDHYHNLSQVKREEGEDQQWKSHRLQEIVFKYKACLITGYQVPKIDYKSDKEMTIKGRADSMETSNYIIGLIKDEEPIKGKEPDEEIYRTKIVTLKSRRGEKKVFDLFQNFRKSGRYNRDINKELKL